MCVSPHKVMRPLSRRDGLRPDSSFTVLPPTAETAACTRPARAGAAPGASATSPRRPSYTPVALWLLPLNDDCDDGGASTNTLRSPRDLFHLLTLGLAEALLRLTNFSDVTVDTCDW